MAVKTSWHRYTTKLDHCHPMYNKSNNKNKNANDNIIYFMSAFIATPSSQLTATSSDITVFAGHHHEHDQQQ